MAPTKLRVKVRVLTGPQSPYSVNSSANTLHLAHVALATLASLPFPNKAWYVPASGFALTPDN